MKSKTRPLALIVDNDRDNCEMYAECLSTRGIRTVEADDGVQALAKASTLHPDIVAADLKLPHLDGAELCRRLKQQARTRDIPVIAVTATLGKVLSS